jgi:NADH-quinone oxidoreductase subunit M
MQPSQLLVVSILLPLIGAVTCLALSNASRNVIRWAALAFTISTLAVCALVMYQFPADAAGQESYAKTDLPWLSVAGISHIGFDVRFHLGLDGLGLWLYGLSALLMISCVLVSWESITEREGLFYAMLLLLECGCLGVFTARDILLFYVFFEFTLIPLFFLIGIWGSEDRLYAASKFFLFTLAGSLLTFLGLLAVVIWAHQHPGPGLDPSRISFSIPEITDSLRSASENQLPPQWQMGIFLALFAGFAIKVPLFPFHTWLPLAHVQAPAAGSVLLAGVLLKMGTYGFLRFSLAWLPDASAYFMPLMIWLAVIGIIYGALVALAQSDIKRLIAYSSVSHLGFVMLGLFAVTPIGVSGATLQMINHGLSTGGLFLLVGMIYERFHSRQIKDFGGLAAKFPILAVMTMVFTFSSIGLPGLNGFAGEFLILLGAFQRGWAYGGDGTVLVACIAAVSGVILGAWYMLWLIQRVFFGAYKAPSQEHGAAGHHAMKVADLNTRELAALLPLVVFCLWIGLVPQHFLAPMDSALRKLTQTAQSKLDESSPTSVTSQSTALSIAETR